MNVQHRPPAYTGCPGRFASTATYGLGKAHTTGGSVFEVRQTQQGTYALLPFLATRFSSK